MLPAMRVAVFSAKSYDVRFLTEANARHGHELSFLEPHLRLETSALAEGFPAVCAFVNDRLDAPVLDRLAQGRTRLVALRSAGFNNVDLEAAAQRRLRVVRVPAYSPHAVAEHTCALILALNRKLHRAYARVREGNFALEGLLGFDLHGRSVGIVGTGRIGVCVARILHGFGCRLLACDPAPNATCEELGVRYVPLEALLGEADVVTLHCPLTPGSYHLIDAAAVARMKRGVMLVNTSRGGLVDTVAVVDGLKSGRIGLLGLDVYEEEADLFFENLSDRILQDDVFSRLLTFPNVIVTGHQGFFTEDALSAIAETTLANLTAFEKGEPLLNEVRSDRVKR